MPSCKKCNQKFPNRIYIGNKIKNLQNRKYCLQCSPFGSHNTRKIHISVNKIYIEKKGVCTICNHEYIYSRTQGHRGSICNSCIVTRHRKRLKQKLVEYKGGKCMICEYSKSIWCLDFHHLNPTHKDFTIGGKSISIERLKKEADKCVLVCRNCHGEIHEEIETKGSIEILNKIIGV